jgi:hypothetical protein
LKGNACSGSPAHPAEVGDAAQREHEVVEGHDVGLGPEAGAAHHHLVLEVHGLDLAHVEVGARQEPPDRAHHVEHADGAGDDLRQHGLEDEVVLLVDEDDLEIVPPVHRLLQGHGRVDAGEASAQHHDAGPVTGLRLRHGVPPDAADYVKCSGQKKGNV